MWILIFAKVLLARLRTVVSAPILVPSTVISALQDTILTNSSTAAMTQGVKQRIVTNASLTLLLARNVPTASVSVIIYSVNRVRKTTVRSAIRMGLKSATSVQKGSKSILKLACAKGAAAYSKSVTYAML